MKKLLKIFSISLGVLLALVLIVVVAASVLINPNDYKDDIVVAIKKETGRKLVMQGDIKLSLFPWLGLELGKTLLENASGFGEKPMASVDGVDIKLQLLPLLRQEIEFKTIVLDGLELNLARNKQGTNNWDDLLKKTSTKKSTSNNVRSTTGAQTSAAASVAAFSIGGVDIRRAQVHWSDASTQSSTHVRNLNLRTSRLESGRPLDIELGFDLETGKPVIRTPVNMRGTVAIDLERETLRVQQLNLTLLDLDVTTDLKGKDILSSPSINGHVSLKPANLRGVLNQLGLPVDMQADALKRVSLETDFSFSQRTSLVSISQLSLQLDDSKLTGKTTVGLGEAPVIRPNISLDQIDMDRYLPVSTKKRKSGVSSTKNKKGKSVPAPLVIPVQLLRRLDLKGSFSLGSLKAMGIHSQKIFIPINANKGIITTGPSRAQLYGGKYGGKQILDVRKGAPRISMNETLKNVEVGDLLKDAGVFDKFSGVGNVSGKLTARGLDTDDILNTLSGDVRIKMKNGRVKGLNLHKMVNDAKDQYRKAKGKPVQSHPKITDEMEYAGLTATAKIKNGLLSNNDLKMKGPFMEVTGKGTVNLPRATMDYRANVLISENKSDPPVPVRIQGPFSKLNFSIEWNKIFEDRARKEVNKRIQQEQKRLDIEKKKVEERLKRQLGNELEKLFKR